jgi:ABC-type dipeptide/oligopeptide/nickel transport system permease component
VWTYIARRLIQTVIVILGVTLISFSALHIGGDPTFLFVPERASDEQIVEARRRLGFDRPLYEQYASFVINAAQGDFGRSLTHRRPAIEVIGDVLPATIELTLFSMIIATVFAVPLGVLAALKRGTTTDGSIMILGMLGQSVPSFWLGIMMIMLFGLDLKWFPISGHVPLLDPLLAGDFATAFTNLPQSLYYLTMPSVAVGVYSLSRNARLVRSSMLEVLSEDYVRTAYAKGLSPFRVIGLHALRNALIPVVTIIGLQVGSLMAGAVLTETIFSWPGVGKWLIESIGRRDYPALQGGILLISSIVIVVNLTVDMLYGFINPRIRHGQ